MYSELGEQFKEKLLSVMSDFMASELLEEPDYSHISLDSLEICLLSGHKFTLHHISSNSYSVLIGMQSKELKTWKRAYSSIQHHILQPDICQHICCEDNWFNNSALPGFYQ